LSVNSVETKICSTGESIVIPALSGTHVARKYGETSYHFLDVKVELIGEESARSVVLTGRFVKNTILRRVQVLDAQGGLSKDDHAIPSAPSAFFVLALGVHRLIYFAETPNAPDLKSFSLAAGEVIRTRYDRFIDEQYAERKLRGDKVTKKALREQHPAPSVVVIPLTDPSDLKAFVSRFQKLTRIQFHLVPSNAEIDGKEMWKAIRDATDRVGAEKTKVEHRSGEGLNKAEAVNEIADASATGNQIVRLEGIDKTGHVLKGDNKNYQLTVPLPDPPSDRTALAKALTNLFFERVDSQTIKIDDVEVDQKALDGIRKAYL